MAQTILYLENQEPINNPNIENIKLALDMINGSEYTMIELTCVNKGTLMVVGGNNNKVMVTFIPEDVEKDSPSLADKTQDDFEEWELTFEGETVTYPARFCISKEMALIALDRFLMSGKIDNDLDWEVAYL
ncbi:MAG: Imm1 family immunity protein [bacterium]